MKIFIIVFTMIVLYAIYTGNMGGARDVMTNYNKLLTGQTDENVKK